MLENDPEIQTERREECSVRSRSPLPTGCSARQGPRPKRHSETSCWWGPPPRSRSRCLFTPVPITGPDVRGAPGGGVAWLGPGVVSLGLYVAAGVLGLPFFAGGAHGASVVAGASGGYLLSYPLVGLVVGRLAQRGWDRRFSSAVAAMLTGNVLIYLVGIPWLAHAMHAPVLSQRVLLAGLYPFIPGDTLKLYLAAAALPATWRFVSRGDDVGADVG